jgi:outer membrane protein, heavy metal efflux system
MKSVSFLILYYICIALLPGQVASGEVLRFTLNTFVERAVAKDLSVGQSSYGKEIAVARNTMALAPSDPEVSISYGTDSLAADEGERAISLSLSQSIRLPGQKKALREIANAESALANSSDREARRQAVLRARTLFLHILAAREYLQFTQQVSELAEELATTVASAAGRGEASGIDAGQTKLKSLAAKAKQAAHEQELGELWAQARVILRAKPSDELVFEGNLAFPKDRLLVPKESSGWRNLRPDLALASLEEQRATARLHEKQSARWGSWRLEGFMEHAREIDAPGGLESEKSHGIGVAVELPWWGRRQGEEHEAKAELGAASLRREILAESIAIEVATAARREKILHQRLSDFRVLLAPLAETNGKNALEAYAQGQISLQQALQVREETLRLKGEYLDLLLEYHLAATNLRAALGK